MLTRFACRFTSLAAAPLEAQCQRQGVKFPLYSYIIDLEDKAVGDWTAGHRNYGLDINDRCRIVQGKKKGELFTLHSISTRKSKDIKKPIIVKKVAEEAKHFNTYKVGRKVSNNVIMNKENRSTYRPNVQPTLTAPSLAGFGLISRRRLRLLV